MTVSNWLEVGGYILAILLLSPFLAFLLAEVGIFFTKLESGDIKFIMHGESLHKTIYDVRDFKLENNQFVKTTPKEESAKTRPWFGLYWVGIPPFASVHRFPIIKERTNPAGKTPEEWVERDKEISMEPSLHFTIPRPFVLRDVELGDRTPIDLLVIAKFEVVDPYIPVFFFKGRFFGNTEGIIKAAVSDILKGTPGKPLTLDQFVASDKGEVSGILSLMKEDKGPLNKELISQIGLRLVGISISKYDPQDGDLREAMNAQVVSEQTAKGVIAKAEGEAKRIQIEAEANALAQERLAIARGAQIRETVSALASTMADHNVVARGAADVLEMEAATGKDSKLTTLVKGGGAPPVIPVGEKK